MSASHEDPSTGISGVILAGGSSRRMGRDKALTPVPETGQTMLASVLSALSTITGDIVIVAPPRAGYETYGLPIVQDAVGPPGPLRGIASGLRAASHERSFVLACDLPYVDASLLAWMEQIETSADVLIPVISGTSRQGGDVVYQTLHAIYRRNCLPAIHRSLAAGDPRTTAFLDQVEVQTIPEVTLRSINPQLRSFRNVNAPADWIDEERHEL